MQYVRSVESWCSRHNEPAAGHEKLQMEPNIEIIRALSREFHLPHPEESQFIHQLALRINELIENDFSGLVQILYRKDISESKVKELLAENTGQDSGCLIAKLLIEREQQKIESRKLYKRDDDIAEDDKW